MECLATTSEHTNALGVLIVTDLVVSEDVGRIPGVLVDVGDSLAAEELAADGHRLSPSLVAALWVTNEVLPQLNQASASRIYAAGDATNVHHRSVTALDESGVQIV
ncbi:hypothetical protein MFAL_34520 [Mycolicibacterium fallax]|nr:hypothetical protein MFAL_34520 [Mycolicibacterium fallax]